MKIRLEFDENNLLDKLYCLTKGTDVYYRLTQDYAASTETVEFAGETLELALVAARWERDDCEISMSFVATEYGVQGIRELVAVYSV